MGACCGVPGGGSRVSHSQGSACCGVRTVVAGAVAAVVVAVVVVVSRVASGEGMVWQSALCAYGLGRRGL